MKHINPLVLSSLFLLGCWSNVIMAGTCFELSGKGAYKQALPVCTKASEQGNAIAQYYLGMMYHEGTGVPQNDKQAIHWFTQAAEQGYARAQYNLGVMYRDGIGVPKNDKQAVHWTTQAAEQGNALAQLALGLLYYAVEGVPKNVVKAYAWWNIAAAQGQEGAADVRGIIEREMTREQIEQAQALSEVYYKKYVKQPL